MRIRALKSKKISNRQSGAAMMEFAIVATVLLGVVLPGMIAVGKSISELNAAAQGSYIAVQAGAQVKVPFTEDATTQQIDAVNDQITGEMTARLNRMYPLMADHLKSTQLNPHVSVLRRDAADPDHWLVTSDMIATFPAILTDIPVRVKSVSSMLNVQPRTGGNLASPQRLRLGGADGPLPLYDCAPRRNGECYSTDAVCAAGCCKGADSRFQAFFFDAENLPAPLWICTGANYGVACIGNECGDPQGNSSD